MHYAYILFLLSLFREAAKKNLLLMARPLRPNPPPSSSLMAVEILERWKRGSKKSSFSLMARPLSPPPLLMDRPLREELFLRLL